MLNADASPLFDPAVRPLVLSGGGLMVLGLVYFVLRWRVSQRRRVRMSTPAIDRRNSQALDHMAAGKGPPGDVAAPAGLIEAVEEAERGSRPVK